ncbi:Duffy receptor-like [Piliocolobus tephrosceles]|uniref:Duffy receptor-like n=1 Tax=Piliocolobus tephrosceles TaxID=591936 RepID=UPI000E6B399F|nr:Duffy receptor-like [Piliocolobus tephrosceles]
MESGLCCKIAEKCLVNPQINDKEYLQCIHKEFNTSLPGCFINKSFSKPIYFTAGGGVLLLILLIAVYKTTSKKTTQESDIPVDYKEFYEPHKINMTTYDDELVDVEFAETPLNEND